MIRDGIVLKAREPGMVKNPVRKVKNSMRFVDFCNMLDAVQEGESFIPLQHFNDPYALMLILGVYEPVDIPAVVPNSAFFDESLLCQEVWERLKEDNPVKIEALTKKINVDCRPYLDLIAQGRNLAGVTVEVVLRELSFVRHFNLDEAYATWLLQPDPEALAFAVLSDLTTYDSSMPSQRITPALGRPVNMLPPMGRRSDIRYPCGVHPYWESGPSGVWVQVHKSLDSVVAFTDNGNLLKGANWFKDKIKGDGLFLGFAHFPQYDSDEMFSGFQCTDVLCVNDLWVHDRPYNERMKFIWRTGKNNVTFLMVYDKNELNIARSLLGGGPVIVHNLNREYSILHRDAQIALGIDTVVQAEVRKTRGTSRFVLQTSDGKRLFVFGTDRISDDEVGKIVEVDINGKILRYRFDLKEAMCWDEVSEIWGVESHDDLLVDGVWPRGIRWRKLKS